MIGGGFSQLPDNPLPAGATSRLTLSNCVGTTCDIGPTAAGTTPTGVDCTDVGCTLGLPIPIANGGLSMCVTNTFANAAPSGTLDTATGTTSLSDANGLFGPGQSTTQKGAFKSDICLTGANSGKPCQADSMGQDPANCGAGVTCRSGTLNNYCNGGTNDGLGCTSSTACGGGTCGRSGPLAQLVRIDGTPAGPLSSGVPAPVALGSTFCVPATNSAVVNANFNIPGPSASALTGTITLLP
jgi:hypothetical protein